MSPSLRGSGLKYPQASGILSAHPSPSLRGSGLKLHRTHRTAVDSAVSLFTREWIEICPVLIVPSAFMSPSLRGSGLKSLACCMSRCNGTVSLFTREWIEISCHQQSDKQVHRLPLYEGVD